MDSAVAAAIVGTALDSIIVIDEDGRVVEWNPAAERCFGRIRDEALGRPIADLIVPPHLREAHRIGHARYLETGEAHVLGRRIVVEAMRADGTLFPAELAITEVQADGRRLFTAHLRDLTEARRAEAEIERQRDALHQSEKMAALGSLLAGVAHELNNPLSIVVGHALMLEEEAPAPLAERAGKIRASAERCARIVRTFLAMARQRRAEMRRVEVAELVEAALDLLGYGLRSAGVEVVRKVPPGLPTIAADPDQLHQVLVNLLVNAQQALAETPEPRRITVSAKVDAGTGGEGDGGDLVLSVSDSGPGVPEAVRSRIFDPFFTTKQPGSGTGVGLSVSRGIAEAHGGSLTLLDQGAGQGAAFELRLPLSPLPEGAEAPAMPSPVAAPRRRALVVDDEAGIGELVAEMLAKDGFDSDVVSNGAAACERMLRTRYDLVLCDLRMPGLDGPGFHAWVERERPEMLERIVFMTGDTLGAAAGRFLARSGRPVIEKPVVPAEIRRVVASL